MLILIFVLGLALLVAGCVAYYKINNAGYSKWYYGEEWIYYTPIITGAILSICIMFAMLGVGISLSGRMTIDEKIDLYRNENAVIESQMEAVIQNYQEYESGTLKEFTNESATILVSLYPELKSNELVAKQLEVYVKNNAKIKELECERLSYKPLAWWLYFGS